MIVVNIAEKIHIYLYNFRYLRNYDLVSFMGIQTTTYIYYKIINYLLIILHVYIEERLKNRSWKSWRYKSPIKTCLTTPFIKLKWVDMVQEPISLEIIAALEYHQTLSHEASYIKNLKISALIP